jgi:hypothetical protein
MKSCAASSGTLIWPKHGCGIISDDTGQAVSNSVAENIIADCMRAALKNLLACPFMNILIEDAEKLEYFTSNNQWTKNAAEGKNFGATGVAFDVAKQEPMGKFNIVAYFPITKQFINMNHGRGKGIAETSAA